MTGVVIGGALGGVAAVAVVLLAAGRRRRPASGKVHPNVPVAPTKHGDGHQVRVAWGSADVHRPPRPADEKYVVRQLMMGKPEEATDLPVALGLNRTQLANGIGKGEQAIIDEFEGPTATAEDRANLHYVYRCRVARANYPQHVQEQISTKHYHGGLLKPGDFDKGHDGMRLDDFVEKANAMLGPDAAKLDRVHVLALRLYTTSSYRQFNDPLRQHTRPHPFAFSVYFLAEGLRLLKGVAAQRSGFANKGTLWRGMRDMTVLDDFREMGGTELAAMSTSTSMDTAWGYAQSRTPLVFKFENRGFTRGCSIDFLSVYPGEKEVLYAPLTYILYKREYVEHNTTVIVVEPQQA